MRPPLLSTTPLPVLCPSWVFNSIETTLGRTEETTWFSAPADACEGAAPLLGTGLVYGAVWWVLGGLLLMPAGLGMPVLQVDASAVPSLIGHLIYGLVTALVFYGFQHWATSE